MRHLCLRDLIVSTTSISTRALSTSSIRATTSPNDQSKQRPIRTRFAPSPTGNIHLGGLRAAFYNYVYAKQRNGQFVLRIEDTDQTRAVPGVSGEFEDVLNWAGLGPDESPRLGGPYGPYQQSERLHLYIDYAHELVEQGKAYRCFCSPARLDLLRKSQSRGRERPHYDRKCRHLSPAEIQQNLVESKGNYAIRFALIEGETVFDDLVFGSIRNDLVKNAESDPVILKTDKYPTYHFANVIDDKLMQITDVIRGAEWISSTAKHIQIYKALNWTWPRFIHFPLITMEDGAKMSKRFNHSHVSTWIEAGHQPLALLNFMTNTGGGVPKEKQDLMEFWKMDDFVKKFDFNKLTVHAGSLDSNRLKIYGSKDLELRWSSDPDKLIDDLFTLMKAKNVSSDIDRQHAKTITSNLIPRISTLNDLLGPDYSFIWQHPELTWPKNDYHQKGWDLVSILEKSMEAVNQSGLKDGDKLIESFRKLSASHGISYGEFMRFLRKILTNKEKGLPILEIAHCLGESRLMSYLKNGLIYVKSNDIDQ